MIAGIKVHVRCVVAAIMTSLCVALAVPASAQGTDGGANDPILAAQSSMTLYVELIVNRLSTGKVVRVDVRNGEYLVRKADLEGIWLPAGAAEGDLVNLSRLPSVETEYDSAAQALSIMVSPTWLPEQEIGGRGRERIEAAVSPGLVINYDLYAATGWRDSGTVSLWAEGRYFGGWGTVVSNGVYRETFGGKNGRGGQNGFLRYDTRYTYTDLDSAVTYEAGDVITGALSWNAPVRLGGLSISRDFSSRPDIITYPLPQFAGQAAVPTAVDLLINGSKVATNEVAPGPFVLNELPAISGAGQATLVTTDALGRSVQTTVPFYVANNLLRPGLWDYSASVGAIRRRYGQSSFAYGYLAVSGSARYGVTPFLTLEGHVEGSQHVQVGGVGAGVRLGMWGVVNGSVAVSTSPEGTGQEYSASYSYSTPRFSVSVRHTERTDEFRDLASFDLRTVEKRSGRRSSTQASGSINLGQSAGSVNAAYYQSRSDDREWNRGAHLSYSRNIGSFGTAFASVSKTFGRDGFSAQLQVVIPLGARSNASVGVGRSANGRWSGRASYSRSVPSDGGLGWNVAYGSGRDGGRAQRDVTWRNDMFQVQAGASRSNGAVTSWASVEGSLIVMGGAVMPANRIGDAFALVDTQGHAGVPVRYENQLIGKTNRGGYLLVSQAPSFYPAKYEIDPLGFSDDAQSDVVEQRVAVLRRAGARIVFPVRKVVAATILLADDAGEPLPVGSLATHRETGTATPIGYNGETYFEDFSPENELDVTLPDGRACLATFALDPTETAFRRIGPLTCHMREGGVK